MPNGPGRGEDGRELGPLPGGHHGLSSEQVTESQRERLLASVAQVVAERGYRATTITEIVKTAAVANRVFYDNFPDKDACFLAAFDAVAAHLQSLIEAEVAGAPDWPQGVIAALRATLGFFAAEPELGHLCLVAPFTATTEIAAHLRATVAPTLPALAAGRKLTPDGDLLPASTEESLLGGAITQISRRILTADQSLDAIFPDLVDFLVAPYLGSETAKRLATEAV